MERRRRPVRGDDGFTLVEMAVVLVVLGVLVGFALPTYLGTRAGAEDQTAKSLTKLALKTHRMLFDDDAGYPDLASAGRAEPNLDFADLPVMPDSDPFVPEVLGKVYVRAGADQVTLVSRSASGRCFWARDHEGVTTYAENDCSEEPVFTDSW